MRTRARATTRMPFQCQRQQRQQRLWRWWRRWRRRRWRRRRRRRRRRRGSRARTPLLTAIIVEGGGAVGDGGEGHPAQKRVRVHVVALARQLIAHVEERPRVEAEALVDKGVAGVGEHLLPRHADHVGAGTIRVAGVVVARVVSGTADRVLLGRGDEVAAAVERLGRRRSRHLVDKRHEGGLILLQPRGTVDFDLVLHDCVVVHLDAREGRQLAAPPELRCDVLQLRHALALGEDGKAIVGRAGDRTAGVGTAGEVHVGLEEDPSFARDIAIGFCWRAAQLLVAAVPRHEDGQQTKL